MDTQEITKELVDILGWDHDDALSGVMQEMEHPGSHVREAWLAANPQTSDEIEAFYAKTTAYIFDLVVEGARDVRRQWREAVIQALKKHRGETRSVRLFDYGGGAGTDSLMFAEDCKQVTYFDLPSLTSEFAGKRFAYHRRHIAQASRTAAYQAEFDALVSFEVLEHLVDPLAHLDEMVRITKPGGMLFLTESFALVTEDYPSHLPQNTQYTGTLASLMQERGCRFLETLEDRIHVFLKGPPVTVIIPIYNALEHTSQLLESISNTHPGYPVTWMLVNDASPDPQIAPLLDTFAAAFVQPCQVIHHAENVGFVQTCNAAMGDTDPNDVLLLNSDTILYDGWVRKLVEAAYTASDIGTAIPLSNNASCYSLFQGIDIQNDLNPVLAETGYDLIEIPTGVGFCLFIKREVLQKVGLFDEVFGKGYGEETDFCRRALKAGYRHVLTPQTFVYHAGGASMVAAQVRGAESITLPEHEHLIKKRYPDYEQAVEEFIQSGVINKLSADLSKSYVTHQSTWRPSIAMVVHNDIFSRVIGGTEFHVRDLVHSLQKDYIFYIIDPAHPDGLGVTAYSDGVKFRVAWNSTNSMDLLKSLNPSLVHIHHLMFFPPAFIDALTHWGGPKVFTVHDYHALCPSFTLINDQKGYCGVPEQRECDRCAKQLFGTGYDTPYQQRMRYQHLIDSVDRVIAPSQAALTVFRKGIVIPDYKAHVLPHPMPRTKRTGATHSRPTPSDGTEELVVGFIGNKAIQKGSDIIRGIISRCAGDPIRFVAIGNLTGSTKDRGKVVSTGLYQREDVVKLIQSHHVDVMVIASPWPETYSYTLTETWMAGVPAIVGPLGAPAERVAATGAGLVMPDYRIDSFADALQSLAQNRALLSPLRNAAASCVPTHESFDAHQKIYSNLICEPPSPSQVFLPGSALALEDVSSWLLNSKALPMLETLAAARLKVFPHGSRREQAYVALRDNMTKILKTAIRDN